MSAAAPTGRPALAALLFDLDGTLVDSEVPGMDVLHDEALRLGLALSREEAHERFRGRRMADNVAFMTAHLSDRSPEFEARFTRQLRERMAERFRQGLSPIAGAQALLTRLRLPCAVATNGPRDKAELTLGLT